MRINVGLPQNRSWCLQASPLSLGQDPHRRYRRVLEVSKHVDCVELFNMEQHFEQHFEQLMTCSECPDESGEIRRISKDFEGQKAG